MGDGATVGVKLLTRFEGDGVQPALRIGELDAVAGSEPAGQSFAGHA
jgi:hypothetical protein